MTGQNQNWKWRLTMARSHRATTVVSFILGAGIGAVATLFFAPKAGAELRDDIAEGVSDGVSQVRRTGKNLKHRAHKIVDLARDHVQDAIDAGDSAYNRAKKA
jgi:gas vesicle protein